jgi:nucleotide-binding universal stress UspA family protein
LRSDEAGSWYEVRIMQILAATDFSTRSNRAVRQAGLLAQTEHARLHIVHIVDDDRPEELVNLEKREAERIMIEQVSSMPELRDVDCNCVVISGDPFDGILRTATDVNADLIVLGAHRRQLLLDIFTGTTIERVVRLGSLPVLMVNNEAQHRYEKVVAAVDMSDASANALRAAVATGLISDAGATLLHAIVAPAKGKMFVGGASQASIDEYVEEERAAAQSELAAFVVTNDLGKQPWSLRVEEGSPMEVIARIVSEVRPDLLVMGTHGRSGLLKVLIGSVTEEALRSLNVDILAVPPARR